MKWAVEIQKTNLVRRNLNDLLDGLGFALIDGIEYPAFTSREIDECNTVAEVFEQAKQLRDAFTGPAEIDPGFTLGSVIDYSNNPPKRHAFLEAHAALFTLSGGTPTLSLSPPKGLSGEELDQWNEERAEMEYQEKLEKQRAKLEPAFRSSRAVKVIELLSNENPSGETLYKIYELLEGHPDNREVFQTQFGISRDQFDRFRDAVHNPTVTGDWARHAYKDLPRTSNPMSKGEAEEFVRNLAASWLDLVRKGGIIQE